MRLLTAGNPKLLKGIPKGYLSFILHLAPAWLSGYNTCPSASAGCAAACLNTAGRGGAFKPDGSNKIQEARIRKTRMFFEQRDVFMAELVKDIQRAIGYAKKKKLTPVFRLNGTSDIRWETIPVPIVENGEVVGNWANVMTMFPDVTFYDYSKHTNRKNIPANYHLTFSRSESNDDAIPAMLAKMNVAVVFNVKRNAPLPSVWNGVKVIDGDETDLRFLDESGVVVGLRGKGRARKGEHNGFVVNV